LSVSVSVFSQIWELLDLEIINKSFNKQPNSQCPLRAIVTVVGFHSYFAIIHIIFVIYIWPSAIALHRNLVLAVICIASPDRYSASIVRMLHRQRLLMRWKRLTAMKNTSFRRELRIDTCVAT
jgi:hypothetical protein